MVRLRQEKLTTSLSIPDRKERIDHDGLDSTNSQQPRLGESRAVAVYALVPEI
jgi:hypothetical protein